MNLLLDTHLLLWVAYEPRKLTRAAEDLLGEPDNILFFSAASLWEVAIKAALGRSDFTVEPAPLRAGLLSNGYRELAIESRHVLALRRLPPIHADPFDRMLLAQAGEGGLTLITADRVVASYGGAVRLV
ncbi:MAG: type II toxin-antitoxin system VapC family toxin [Phyllobacteriaceae bacterium]|nr:type II toxin-antitoxin system VapC family toxin [Phyllobacteriaceae bacterium]